MATQIVEGKHLKNQKCTAIKNTHFDCPSCMTMLENNVHLCLIFHIFLFGYSLVC